jgi:hypothetical protein
MENRTTASTNRWLHLLVLAAYILLSLALCFPLPSRLTTHVVGRYVDTRVFQWNNWWVKQAFLKGLDLDHTDFIYYPSGVSLVSHNLNWISSALSIPLDLLLGPTVAYNLLFLLTFFLSAFGAYLLVYDRTRHRAAAFAAGLVFAFAPYHVSGNLDGQMNLANVQWLPLYALFLLRTVERKRIADALLAGLFLALASLDCWFFAIFLGLWTALYVAYSLATAWKRWDLRTVGLLLLAGLSGFALTSPFLIPVIVEGVGGAVESALSYYDESKATDLVAFFIPSSDHPLLSTYVRPIYERLQHWRPAFLGYVALVLALYALIVRFRRSLPWFLSGLIFALLSLGTNLRVMGVEYPAIPMPYALLTDLLPPLAIVRQANRFNVMVSLSLAVLVGIALADLLPRLASLLSASAGPTSRSAARIQWATAALLSALILFEYLFVPCPLSPSEVSPFYHALAREGSVLLELPMNDFHSRRSLYPQTVHGAKLVNGYVARTPDGAQGFIRSQPLLKAVGLQMEVDPGLHDIEREIGLLAANDIGYVVLHKQPLPPQPPVDDAVIAHWRQLFGPEAAYEDDAVVAYRTRLAPGYSATPIIRFAGRLGAMELLARRTHTDPDPSAAQSLTVDLAWKALADLDQDYALSLALVGSDGRPLVQTSVEEISPRYPTSRWPEGVVVADRYELPIDPALPAGEYTLSLTLVDAATGAALDVAQHPIRIEDASGPLVPALERMQHPEQITFGDEMRLLGYTPRPDGERLVVDLYWEALRAMDESYKVFVHLVRPSDGAIVAQHDAMPRNWSYPTSLWGRREVFVDPIALDVSGVQPGTYALAVGVYLPEGDRLPALDSGVQSLPDARAILREPVVVEGR